MVSIFLEIDFSWFVDRIVETQGTREANERDEGRMREGWRASLRDLTALLTGRLHWRATTPEVAELNVVFWKM